MDTQSNTIISCEAFYNTNTRQLTVQVPAERAIRFESDSDVAITPKKRGRPSIYSSDEERKAKHREQALRYYYRKKALNDHSHSDNDDEVRLTISTHSKTLGDIAEDITFKRVNGRLRKQR